MERQDVIGETSITEVISETVRDRYDTRLHNDNLRDFNEFMAIHKPRIDTMENLGYLKSPTHAIICIPFINRSETIELALTL
jgi:hypothetical protein